MNFTDTQTVGYHSMLDEAPYEPDLFKNDIISCFGDFNDNNSERMSINLDPSKGFRPNVNFNLYSQEDTAAKKADTQTS